MDIISQVAEAHAPLAGILTGSWLFMLFTTLGLIASEFFSVNIELLSQLLGLNDSTMGATLLAVANALPDFFSTFRAIQAGAGNLAIGELLGAAIFLVTILSGGVMITSPFRVDPPAFFRDTGALFMATVSILGCLYIRAIPLAVCAWLLMLFVVFVVLVIMMRNSEGTEETEPLFPQETHDVESPMITGHYSLLAAMEFSELAEDMRRTDSGNSLGLSVSRESDPLCTYIRASREERSPRITAPQISVTDGPSTLHVICHALFPSLCNWSDHSTYGKVVSTICVPPLLVLRATVPAPAGVSERVESITHEQDYPDQLRMHEWYLLNAIQGVLTPIFVIWASGATINIVPQWALMVLAGCAGFLGRRVLEHSLIRGFTGFFIGSLWIIITVDEVVRRMLLLGKLTNMSETLLGFTVFTFGNSIGDVVTNLAVARMGHPLMSLSACFASPLVNVLLGIGLSCAWMQLGKSAAYPVATNPSMLLSSSILTCTLAFMLIVVPLFGYNVGRPLGLLLITIYTVFMCFTIAFELAMS